MKNRITVILIAFLIFVTTACGGAARNGSDQDNESQPGDMTTTTATTTTTTTARDDKTTTTAARPAGGQFAEVDIDNVAAFHSVETTFQLAEIVREINYSYRVKEEGKADVVNQYELRVLDEKMIDGHQAYRIEYKHSDDNRESILDAWITENEIISAEVDGVKREGVMLSGLTVTLNALMQPFFPTIMWSGTLSKPMMQTVLRWELSEESVKSVKLDSGSASVHYMVFHVGENEMIFEIAKFAEKSFFIFYSNTNSDQKKVYEFQVTHLIPK
jgi:hypothetical protein